MNIFYNIDATEREKLLHCLEAKTINFKKNRIIVNNASNTNTLYIIKKGHAEIIRIEYNGNKTVLEKLNEGDIFESKMYNIINNELNIISTDDTDVIMIEYDKVINRCKNNCSYHNQLIENLLKEITFRFNKNYERIQILTKKSIREKLLEYFKLESNKYGKSFKINRTYIEIADYISCDRTALMRELKMLKEDDIISINNKKVKINF